MTSLKATLDAILAGRSAAKCETDVLDFKEEKSNFKEACADLADAAVCFANARGGTIIVGVADSLSGSAAFTGCTLDASILRSRIHQLTVPSLLVEIEELWYAETRLLRIQVPAGLEVYSTTKGYSYQRINTDCVPMRPADITRLMEERQGFDWSATSSRRSIEDIDPLAMRLCRRLLAASSDSARQRYAKFNAIDLLNAMKLIGPDDHLTHAGEILLCSPIPRAPQEVIIYQHKRSRGGEADAILRLETPLLFAFDEVMQAIRARQGITPVTLANGQQLQIEDYPSAAIREALVNALVHGDWRTRVPVRIEHSPQHIRISSPGPLVSGVTVRNILTRGSRARFPSLAAAFRLLGLAEDAGQGVDRMYREMIRSGRDVPQIIDDREEVTVLFQGKTPKTRVTKFLATLSPDEQQDTDTLLIIHLLCEKKNVKASLVAEYIQRTPEEAQDSLRRLASEPIAILEPTRATMNRKHPSYRLRADAITLLGSAISYHQRAVDDIDKKIIEHLKDYGEVNNRTIQRLFDVDVYQARDILRSLVERKVIERSSTQRRGVAVKYSPGSEFPRKKSQRRKQTEPE
ncbi:RNA-binding domain-containing protein [Actinoalloteichus hymeniacidonis]|uniref:Transcriptional regulator with HTH domain n=1 Tax=Actinoalloteichus hymeniacidonis TaxID=340345 RepID=A0AAC9HV06_9PSEU|nr:RNA-binding domain-containing protein [Actinoalloteichus hymeniacidonis]AOS65481.1 putative transcriptional regulator with HTH domain [Actinoalloteichus hymeniacidonis]MBB5906432.1 ATP-dependent DNA helicase RecG [Actinoalloteichus hymeniacidonis]